MRNSRFRLRAHTFFGKLMNFLWLANTKQQPTRQTTWLKVIPNCNHTEI